MENLEPGDDFAGYTVERALGRGGMGTVYLARHPRLPRSVALKLLNAEFFDRDDLRRRFEREADIAGRLDHPNIVAVYDRGLEGEQLWISMQYVPGMDAAHAIGRGRMDARRALHIIRETGRALDYAHGEFGLLHRDVKPSNIFLTSATAGQDDRVLLGDFGIAKITDEVTALTQLGVVTATMAYASPEQIEGRPLDSRSDGYALACTLFHLLAGRPPYVGELVAAVMHGHLSQPPPRITAFRHDLPPAMDAVFATALAKDPRHRFGTCREFADAVAEAVNRSAPGAGAAVAASGRTAMAPGGPFPPAPPTATLHHGGSPGGRTALPPAGPQPLPVPTSTSSGAWTYWLLAGVVLLVVITVAGVLSVADTVDGRPTAVPASSTTAAPQTGLDAITGAFPGLNPAAGTTVGAGTDATCTGYGPASAGHFPESYGQWNSVLSCRLTFRNQILVYDVAIYPSQADLDAVIKKFTGVPVNDENNGRTYQNYAFGADLHGSNGLICELTTQGWYLMFAYSTALTFEQVSEWWRTAPLDQQ